MQCRRITNDYRVVPANDGRAVHTVAREAPQMNIIRDNIQRCSVIAQPYRLCLTPVKSSNNDSRVVTGPPLLKPITDWPVPTSRVLQSSPADVRHRSRR